MVRLCFVFMRMACLGTMPSGSPPRVPCLAVLSAFFCSGGGEDDDDDDDGGGGGGGGA